ncbi:hypothetical protein N5J06_03905 [Ralstonia sp. CHL-2022]|uniref:Uncharacterized protein n=1 Tax=Ralstonia mojiangensis TaxID=2953895 RepID=A0ABT2L5T9_9RALS|nr:hypothetical protein [Ralstonia mojiangensis]MCT7310074.1 hypothetical protein [Ralstonia mojiangensis]
MDTSNFFNTQGNPSCLMDSHTSHGTTDPHTETDWYKTPRKLLQPGDKYFLLCSQCGTPHFADSSFDFNGPMTCTVCFSDVYNGGGLEIAHTVIDGMQCEHPALFDVVPASFFWGRKVFATNGEAVHHSFSTRLQKSDANCTNCGCCDDGQSAGTVAANAEQAESVASPPEHLHSDIASECEFCGMSHRASEPCVSPRGALPPGEKYVTVCNVCTTIYVTDKASDDAAEGSVCPYCLVDSRKRSDVRVPTLAYRFPHEFAVPREYITARDQLGDPATFQGAPIQGVGFER